MKCRTFNLVRLTPRLKRFAVVFSRSEEWTPDLDWEMPTLADAFVSGRAMVQKTSSQDASFMRASFAKGGNTHVVAHGRPYADIQAQGRVDEARYTRMIAL